MRVRVPSRPVWAEVYKNCAHDARWQDQELLEVTRETLRLSLSALREVISQDAYHNYMAAADEIDQVMKADE